MKNSPKTGDFVISRFRSRWKGVILDIEKNQYGSLIATVLVIKTRNGEPPRKRILHYLNLNWLDKCEILQTDHINTDWFVLKN